MNGCRLEINCKIATNAFLDLPLSVDLFDDRLRSLFAGDFLCPFELMMANNAEGVQFLGLAFILGDHKLISFCFSPFWSGIVNQWMKTEKSGSNFRGSLRGGSLISGS